MELYDRVISTHSPRTGRTRTLRSTARKSRHFNSLAPHGANPCPDVFDPDTRSFQLTRPARGEPNGTEVYVDNALHFNSLAPHGANLAVFRESERFKRFQLTRPARGEPIGTIHDNPELLISTHSPRTGRTSTEFTNKEIKMNFNSLAPHGANRCFSGIVPSGNSFQLTRPARGEPPYLAIGLLAHHYLGRTFTFRLILSSVFFRFFPRTSRDFRVVCGSHDQNMIKPSLSYPAFAPICSTFFFQSFPR